MIVLESTFIQLHYIQKLYLKRLYPECEVKTNNHTLLSLITSYQLPERRLLLLRPCKLGGVCFTLRFLEERAKPTRFFLLAYY